MAKKKRPRLNREEMNARLLTVARRSHRFPAIALDGSTGSVRMIERPTPRTIRSNLRPRRAIIGRGATQSGAGRPWATRDRARSRSARRRGCRRARRPRHSGIWNTTSPSLSQRGGTSPGCSRRRCCCPVSAEARSSNTTRSNVCDRKLRRSGSSPTRKEQLVASFSCRARLIMASEMSMASHQRKRRASAWVTRPRPQPKSRARSRRPGRPRRAA